MPHATAHTPHLGTLRSSALMFFFTKAKPAGIVTSAHPGLLISRRPTPPTNSISIVGCLRILSFDAANLAGIESTKPENTHTMAARILGGPASIFGLAMGIGIAQSAIYDVRGGSRAVIFDRLSGVQEKVVNEGTHFVVPWLQKPIIFDVRTKPRNIATVTGSKDLQMVSLTLRVLHRPEVPNLPKIYQNLGPDYDERVLPSIGNEVLKSIVAQFDAAELITQRETVSNRIRADLTRRAKEFNIALEDVSITHMTFGKEFTKAVEQKQIAQQDAERARFIVEKAEQERQANVIRAEGEAESADAIAKAIAKHGDGLVQIRKIEASREIAATLAANPNVAYLPGGKQGGNFLMGIGK